jgi:hypothetical protein
MTGTLPAFAGRALLCRPARVAVGTPTHGLGEGDLQAQGGKGGGPGKDPRQPGGDSQNPSPKAVFHAQGSRQGCAMICDEAEGPWGPAW